MRKRALILLLAGGWLLAACQGAATPDALPGTPAGQVEPFATAETVGALQPTATSLPTSEAGSSTAPATPSTQAQCTVVSGQPTPGPTQQSLFPPVDEGDWVKGPESADITLIEYSDFQ